VATALARQKRESIKTHVSAYFEQSEDEDREWTTWKKIPVPGRKKIITTIIKDCEPMLKHYTSDDKKRFVDSWTQPARLT